MNKFISVFMKWKIGILYGFLLWLIPFIVSFIVYPFKLANSPVFETIMAITLVLVGSIFFILYVKKSDNFNLTEGLKLGILFLIISIIIDLFLFMEGPMKMSFSSYMLDIGLTYLVYPILGALTGYVNDLK